MIEITSALRIPDEEVSFRAARSGGPGGQRVNKVSTMVTLLFRPAASAALSPEQKAKVLERLAARISRGGVLRVVSRGSRSQSANRRAALERFAGLLREALSQEAPRRPTRPPRASREMRLEQKKRRSRLKSERSARGFQD